MRIHRPLFIAACLLAATSAWPAQVCPPAGHPIEQLQELKQSGFELPDTAARNALARALLDCLANPDPAIRDGIVFEGISHWLRAGLLAADTIDALYTRLVSMLTGSEDPGGFEQPFAALILAEVARTDRVEPGFSDGRRAQLVDIAARYISTVSDYRGYSETEGWRHGVAHGSDLVLQLVLNPEIDAGQVKQLLDALASQVAPAAAEPVFYIYGEPGRLARAVFYAHRRDLLTAEDWQAWFDRLASPAPFPGWNATYNSQQGLARRHNTLAFLQALYLSASAAGDAAGDELAALVMHSIEQIYGA